MNIISYNKLIRDKIPEIIEQSGKKAIVEELESQSFKEHLDAKLKEELQEYLDADNVEELADLVEIAYAILKYKGVDISDSESIRKQKALERGAFEKRLLLKEVVEE